MKTIGIKYEASGRSLNAKVTRQLFVARRAWRSANGRCSRSDVMKAFGVSEAVATGDLNSAAADPAFALKRCLQGVQRNEPDALLAPSALGMQHLAAQLEMGLIEPYQTGLWPHELPLLQIRGRHGRPQAQVLNVIIQAIAAEGALSLRYVSMRHGNEGEQRKVVPLSLNQFEGTWRMNACDLEKKGYPQRSFVLTRIEQAEQLKLKLPLDFRRPARDPSQARVRVEWQDYLSEAQRIALAREFAIGQDMIIEMYSNEVHDFKERFVGPLRPGPKVWPPFKIATWLGQDDR